MRGHPRKLPSQEKLYDNCLILDPRGEAMYRCSLKRAEWYIKKGLGTQVEDNPLTVRLNFEPKGPGDRYDPYTLSPHPNYCIVCGAASKLTKHHVVPYGYRKYFPLAAKTKASHDILPLCEKCHGTYEEESDKLKQQLAEKHNAPFKHEVLLQDPQRHQKMHAFKCATALTKFAKDIPSDRAQHLRSVISEHLGFEPSDEDIRKIADGGWPNTIPEDYIDHAIKVIDSFPSLDTFVKMWREHFLVTMKPRHLSSLWEVDRPAFKP